MILAFCVTGTEEPYTLDDRFGRCHSFAIVDANRPSGEGKVLKTLENTGREASGGAGSSAVQLLAGEGVEGIVAPHLGPKAEDARTRMDMKLWSQGNHKNLADALAAWFDNSLEDLSRKEAPKGLYRA